jgi:hypothetical protein
MAMENGSSLVIMLCPFIENDKQMSSYYLPTSGKPED